MKDAEQINYKKDKQLNVCCHSEYDKCSLRVRESAGRDRVQYGTVEV